MHEKMFYNVINWVNVLKNIKVGLKRHIIRVTNIKLAKRVRDILLSMVKLNDF